MSDLPAKSTSLFIGSGTIGQGEHSQLATSALAAYAEGRDSAIITNDIEKTLKAVQAAGRTLRKDAKTESEQEKAFLATVTLTGVFCGIEGSVNDVAADIACRKELQIGIPKTETDMDAKAKGIYAGKLSTTGEALHTSECDQQQIKDTVKRVITEKQPAHVDVQSGSIAEQRDYIEPVLTALENIKKDAGIPTPYITGQFRDVAAASPALMREAEPILDKYINICNNIGFRGDGTAKHLDLKHSKDVETEEKSAQTATLQQKFDENVTHYGYDAMTSTLDPTTIQTAKRPILVGFGGEMQDASYVHLHNIRESFDAKIDKQDSVLEEAARTQKKAVFFPHNLENSKERLQTAVAIPVATPSEEGIEGVDKRLPTAAAIPVATALSDASEVKDLTFPLRKHFKEVTGAVDAQDEGSKANNPNNISCDTNGDAYGETATEALTGIVTGGWNSVGEMLNQGRVPIIMVRGGEGLEIHEHRVRADALEEKELAVVVLPEYAPAGPVVMAQAMNKAMELAKKGPIPEDQNITFGGGAVSAGFVTRELENRNSQQAVGIAA